MSNLVQQLRKVIDTPRGRIPVSVIYLCRNVANELERLSAELKRVQELHTGLMKNADERYDALTAELTTAKATIVRATELADDLYSYCIDQWRWKYGEYWDGELAAIRAALTDKKE